VQSPVLLGLRVVYNFTAPKFATSSPVLPALQASYNLTAANLAVAALAPLAAPIFGQAHLLTAPNFTVAALGLPALKVVYNFTAGLTVSSPILGAPNVVNTVAAALAVSSPVLGAPVFFANAILYLGDRTLDFGIDVLDTECNAIYVCSSQPFTYLE